MSSSLSFQEIEVLLSAAWACTKMDGSRHQTDATHLLSSFYQCKEERLELSRVKILERTLAKTRRVNNLTQNLRKDIRNFRKEWMSDKLE